MFQKAKTSFNMEIVKNSIRCVWCNGKLEKPVLLPCGESICEVHSKRTSADSNRAFYCAVCDASHEIPDNGFARNKAIERIILSNIDSLNFGKDYQLAVDSCKQLESHIKSLEFLTKDPVYFIKNSICELKNQVELKREQLKLEVDKKAEELLSKLNTYENECEQRLKTTNDLERMQEITRNCWAYLSRRNNELNMFEIDLNKWKHISENVKKITQHVQTKIKKLKNSLMMNELDSYQNLSGEFGQYELINQNKFEINIFLI